VQGLVNDFEEITPAALKKAIATERARAKAHLYPAGMPRGNLVSLGPARPQPAVPRLNGVPATEGRPLMLEVAQ
jgi:hypothetical protein